jgi:hypothetical protein
MNSALQRHNFFLQYQVLKKNKLLILFVYFHGNPLISLPKYYSNILFKLARFKTQNNRFSKQDRPTPFSEFDGLNA